MINTIELLEMSEQKVDLKAYNQLQIEEIKLYIAERSEEAGQPLGEECVLEWIRKHSAEFRERYMASLNCYN